MLNRSYYNRKDIITPRRKEVSTKILSLGVFIVGVIFLTVGLIMGIQFPDHVDQMIINEHCILNADHVNYKNWVDGSSRRRLNRIYYFNLDNPKAFLFAGETPVFTEKGPYIYEEKERKLDVRFSGGSVSFGTMRTQIFRSDLTTQECGVSCTEFDNLTVINRDITTELDRYGSLEILVLSKLPSVISSIITSYTGSNSAHQFLGNLGVSNETDKTLERISFGSWIAQNDTKFKANILSTLNDSFSEREMQSLYSILKSANKLGVTSSTLRGYWQDDLCDDVIYLNVCNKTFNDTVVPPDIQNACLLKVRDCGLACLLKITYMQKNDVCLSKYVSELDALFCPMNTPGCFKLSDKDTAVLSYLDALNKFILVYLFQFVYSEIETELFNLYVTKTQRELALGYTVLDPTSSDSLVEVDGVLRNDLDVESAKRKPRFTLYTCLENRDIRNNFVIKDYSGSPYVPDIVGTSNKISIRSATSYIRPTNLIVCTACHPSSESPVVYVEYLQRPVRFLSTGETSFREENVYRFKMDSGTFQKDDRIVFEDCLQRLNGLEKPLEWISNPHFLGYSNLSTCYNTTSSAEESRHLSYIDVEPATGVFWMKKFRFQYNVGVREKDTKGYVPSLSVSFTDRPLPVYWTEYSEEITDREYDRYQYVDLLTFAMKHSSISLNSSLFKLGSSINIGALYEAEKDTKFYVPSLSVSFTDRPLPVYWTEHSEEITDREYDRYQYVVTRLMRTSCGGLIGMTVLAVIVMVIGIGITALPKVINKVSPALEEPSTQTSK